MKCLRCGYCCKNYFVPIVDNPTLGIMQNNLIMHEGDGTPCKHLKGDKPGEYECLIHSYPWYDQTPCYSHGQVENREDSECRVGRYMIDHYSIKE